MSDADVYFKTGLTVGVSSVGPVGPILGIPDTFHIDVTHLPKITMGIDPIHMALDSIPKITMAIDPIDFSMRIKELPSIRAHLPADFSVGLSLLGLDLLCLRLCGEAQLITEPYVPNPCEICGQVHSDAHPHAQATTA